MTSPIVDRAQLPNAQRVVVKIGSSSLTRADGRLNVPALRKLVDVLAEESLAGKQVVLVSSGAIAAGFMPLGYDVRPSDVAGSQAAAAVGQSALMAQYTDAFGAYEITVGQILMTAADTLRRDRYTHVAQAFERMLELGAVPIVNENDALATSELKFGDNDRLAALVAQLVRADALVLLTDVNGLYDAPPKQPGASRISVVEHMEDVAGVQVTGRGSAFGTGGMVTKLQSAEMATTTCARPSPGWTSAPGSYRRVVGRAGARSGSSTRRRCTGGSWSMPVPSVRSATVAHPCLPRASARCLVSSRRATPSRS
jgi:glutamate 5-kinase